MSRSSPHILSQELAGGRLWLGASTLVRVGGLVFSVYLTSEGGPGVTQVEDEESPPDHVVGEDEDHRCEGPGPAQDQVEEAG